VLYQAANTAADAVGTVPVGLAAAGRAIGRQIKSGVRREMAVE
jgi:hypothetical protein